VRGTLDARGDCTTSLADSYGRGSRRGQRKLSSATSRCARVENNLFQDINDSWQASSTATSVPRRLFEIENKAA
jgi:hypothetical protein